MKTNRIIAIAVLIAATGLALHVGQAQQVGARRIDLQRHDLSVPGREVVQTIVELAPGTTAPRHKHPGEEIIYVLEGTWEYTVEGKPPVTLKAGDVLFLPAGTVHSARNVGTGRAAELATYIVEKASRWSCLSNDRQYTFCKGEKSWFKFPVMSQRMSFSFMAVLLTAPAGKTFTKYLSVTATT